MKTGRFVYAVLKMEWTVVDRTANVVDSNAHVVGVYRSFADAKRYIKHDAAANGYIGDWTNKDQRWQGTYGTSDLEGVTYAIQYTGLF